MSLLQRKAFIGAKFPFRHSRENGNPGRGRVATRPYTELCECPPKLVLSSIEGARIIFHSQQRRQSFSPTGRHA
jgi:hypothetical protein